MRTSEQLDQISQAFAAAQAALTTVRKDKTANIGQYAYTYASLATVMESATAALSSHGLAIVQSLAQDEGQVTVTTRLLHSSGQWIEGDCTMPVGKGGPQAVGSAITYGRRYGISALLGIVADDDDDGAAAEQSAQGQRVTRVQDKPATVAAAASVTLDKVLAGFAVAETLVELDSVAAQAKSLSEGDRAKARIAYTGRKAALAEQAPEFGF